MIKRFLRHFKRRTIGEIDPDEILIDSSNLPKFDIHQFEGRLERSISRKTIMAVSILFLFIGMGFLFRLWVLQIHKGEVFARRSEMNRLRQIDIFSNRGVIFDRNGVELASNAGYERDSEFAERRYAAVRGVAHLIGYVKYPTKDSSGFYFRDSYVGEDGVEKAYNDILSGEKGVRIVETDALGEIQSESVIRPPKDGTSLVLTIDSRLNDKIYEIMGRSSAEYGFTGGAAIMMDVRNGDVLSMVSFPEYDSSIITEGDKKLLAEYITDPKKPFLNRAVSGLYTPGSIVKPAIALGALEEGIISPEKKILSVGSISIQNPYFPDKYTVFRDWKAHGWVDMRQALAVSSNVYFFSVGGGFEDQKGLGIFNIEKYLRIFGLGDKTGINISHEEESVIPNPDWKSRIFDGDAWRIGDTYNTAIGQYGLQFTPIQVARYISAIANGGKLLTPRLIHGVGDERVGNESEQNTDDNIVSGADVPIKKEFFQIVKEGLRRSVTEGTASGVSVPYVQIAAKTGTAELGSRKELVNSWIIGFFPYDDPIYAFVVLMEKGPRSNLVGATSVMRQLLDWMNQNAPEYFRRE